MKKRKNSRRKGAVGERDCSAYLNSLGFPAERAARNGVDAGEDVLCPSVDVLYRIEVKFLASWTMTSIRSLWAKAKADAIGRGKIAIMFVRCNRQPWHMLLEDASGRLCCLCGDDDIRSKMRQLALRCARYVGNEAA